MEALIYTQCSAPKEKPLKNLVNAKLHQQRHISPGLWAIIQVYCCLFIYSLTGYLIIGAYY